ncbi:MAG: hypothetical protein QW767_05310 [Thermoprotei archaeon]
MDKTLSQAMILLITVVLLASLFSTLGVAGNSDAVYSEAQSYEILHSAGSRLYFNLVQNSVQGGERSELISVNQPSEPLVWVCRNEIITLQGEFTWPCNSLTYNSTSVQRSFDAGGYYYYLAMAYIPTAYKAVSITFRWYFSSQTSVQPVEIFVSGVPGNQEQIGWYKGMAQYSKVLYYSTWDHGGTVSGTASAYGEPGWTIVFGLGTSAAFTSQVKLGLTNIASAEWGGNVTVSLPAYMSAQLDTDTGNALASSSGPTAQFNLSSIAAHPSLVDITFQGSTVASFPENLSQGEKFIYVAAPQCDLTGCPFTIVFPEPIRMDAQGSRVLLQYGEQNYTLNVPVNLFAHGLSSAWTFYTLGCESVCSYAAFPIGQL